MEENQGQKEKKSIYLSDSSKKMPRTDDTFDVSPPKLKKTYASQK